ncbi:MAG: isoprenylcysteine carboxylmethyltransferase family protein [Methylophaga sp.]|nr:isoprenylcysteine carboxylmethyltransferase family protein [Methylophaga sp.]
MEDKGSSGVIIPPPIVYFVCILIGIGLNYLWPFSFFPQSIQDPIGYSIIALSILLFGLVLREFSKSGTSTDYRKSTVAIISTGPFCYSRNPIYLSLTMLNIGVAFVVGSFWVIIMTIPAVLIVHYAVILKEEAYLIKKFGDEYHCYMNSVRRWI